MSLSQHAASNDASAQPVQTQSGKTLLAVFAHPDDEAFSVAGILTHYARQGVRVVVACATRGEAGKITVPDMTIDDLGEQREQELCEACQIMGIEPPIFLGFHDSGRFERTRHDDPLALLNLTPLEIEHRIREVIAQVKPQVMITFDPHGSYGHIDHLQIHRAAVGAFFSTGHLEYGGPQRLFFTALTNEGAENTKHLDDQLDPLIYGVSESTIAFQMDIADYVEIKKATMAAHGTQMGSTGAVGRLTGEARERFEHRIFSGERLSLGSTRGPIPRFPLGDLFEGL